MKKTKKILSWILLSSLIIWNFSFSYTLANNISTLTDKEKQKIEKEILKLQTNILNNYKATLNKLASDFKKLTNYEEYWNSRIEFNIDEKSFWAASGSLDLKNYKIKNAVLDSDISTEVLLNVNYSPIYGSWFKFDLTKTASLISKDGEMYVLFKDLDFKVSDEDIQKNLEEFKKQFNDNKYIKLPADEQSKMIFGYINNFNLKNFYNQAENVLSKPLLTTYKKSWNKYLLVPTKYACDIFFELGENFNFWKYWYKPKKCSENVYKSFIKEFIKYWEFYLILDKENTLGFYLKKDNLVIDSFVKYNKQNNFVEISFNVKSTNLTWNLTLKNKKISWFYIYKDMWYDYTDWQNLKYKLKNVYWIKITWTTTKENKLEKLNLKFAWVDIKTKKTFLTWKTSYNKWNFVIKLSSNNEYSSFNFNWTWYMSSEYFKLNSAFKSIWVYTWKLNVLLDARENKNDANIDFNINNWVKDIVKLKLVNNWKRVYKEDIKIETPTDFKEFSSIEKINEALYIENK